uniref:Viral protein 7 n=1 Tax=Porcine rotavirus H TaxID=1420855 RepID=A0A3G9DJY6_9REOV|nr:Viral protein 7 [Porcine rotavirus H]
MLFLLVFVVGANAITHIQSSTKTDVCLIYELQDSTNFATDNKTLADLWRQASMSYQVCRFSVQQNPLLQMQECKCIYDETPLVMVFTEWELSSLKTLIGTENRCVRLPQQRMYVPDVDIQSEYFIFGNNVKICYLDANLLGINCDSSNTQNWITLSPGLTTNSAIDIPEITMDGFKLYAQYGDSFICERVASESTKQVTFYAKVGKVPADDVIESARSWASAWKVVKTMLHFTYHVLDVFFGNRRAIAKMNGHLV